MVSIRTTVEIPIQDSQKQEVKADFVTFNELTDDKEHVALVFKQANEQQQPLVRIHSECLTGDIFHSARCDCGAQLQEAIDSMSQVGGILLYLRQEGRGIGLYNKLDAYKLQDKGMDTFEANNHLGFDNDLRDFTVAAQMLEAMNIKKIKLLSNNPKKRQSLIDNGIDVEEVQTTGVFSNKHNIDYLKAKTKVENHDIKFNG